MSLPDGATCGREMQVVTSTHDVSAVFPPHTPHLLQCESPTGSQVLPKTYSIIDSSTLRSTHFSRSLLDHWFCRVEVSPLQLQMLLSIIFPTFWNTLSQACYHHHWWAWSWSAAGPPGDGWNWPCQKCRKLLSASQRKRPKPGHSDPVCIPCTWLFLLIWETFGRY